MTIELTARYYVPDDACATLLIDGNLYQEQDAAMLNYLCVAMEGSRLQNEQGLAPLFDEAETFLKTHA
jgi:hypothetical protein